MFATSGVDAPVREIAEKAGVGIGTVYRHFPQRSDLIAAVFRHEIDACAEAAPRPRCRARARRGTGEMVAAIRRLYCNQTRACPGPALGKPGLRTLARVLRAATSRPALRTLLESAVAAGEVRNDVESDDLLQAVASLCMPAQDDGQRAAHGRSARSTGSAATDVKRSEAGLAESGHVAKPIRLVRWRLRFGSKIKKTGIAILRGALGVAIQDTCDKSPAANSRVSPCCEQKALAKRDRGISGSGGDRSDALQQVKNAAALRK